MKTSGSVSVMRLHYPIAKTEGNCFLVRRTSTPDGKHFVCR